MACIKIHRIRIHHSRLRTRNTCTTKFLAMMFSHVQQEAIFSEPGPAIRVIGDDRTDEIPKSR